MSFFLQRTDKYNELEEDSAVLIPLHPTSLLLPEHFSSPLQQLRYPVRLDFSHERFRLRSISLLLQLRDTALVELDLNDNELKSISELNRFAALKSLTVCRNALESGPGVQLAVHRLMRLDLSGNRLTTVPSLKELPLLKILNISRNEICDGWQELARCTGLQALDASYNALQWDEDELRRSMSALRAVKRLRVLSLVGNPATACRGYRAWVLANARKLELLDETPVTEVERHGDDGSSSAASSASSVAPWRRPEGAVGKEAGNSGGTPELSASGSLIFGLPLDELLSGDGSLLPRLVEECTQHAQEQMAELWHGRRGTGGAVSTGAERLADVSVHLVADPDPSSTLALRRAFERSTRAGAEALVEMRSRAQRRGVAEDVRAACSVVRAFLLEMPQPLVHVELFLPLLESTRKWEGGAGGGRRMAAGEHEARGATLEAILNDGLSPNNWSRGWTRPAWPSMSPAPLSVS